ncbi:hypothetical protein BK816_01220 [Boudabousia tangfeifanii]|uniref:Uncharacterized protein n=1 Tax=Boudabousia tangfeifanii TaxID=1912795 RepID=A0A1D9MIH4_9ACTO|nr:hypothetical protein [Boudabousia tangfeifanii]AOZ72084.1 hypothetical protein BK816_01220 [Boudabousia tangfeifanii]
MWRLASVVVLFVAWISQLGALLWVAPSDLFYLSAGTAFLFTVGAVGLNEQPRALRWFFFDALVVALFIAGRFDAIIARLFAAILVTVLLFMVARQWYQARLD